jgi:flagellar hook-length control protein FliK
MARALLLRRRDDKDSWMTAQPISSVPSATKAPPAPSQSGHGVGAFIDHLDNGATSQSTVTTLGGSRARVPAWHRDASRTARAANDSNPTSTAATAQVAPLAQPVQPSSNSTPVAAANTAGTASSAPAPQAFAPPSGGATADATANARAANLVPSGSGNSAFNGFSALLDAGATITSLGQKTAAADPSGKSLTARLTTNTLTANNVSLPTSLLAQVQRATSDAATTATPSPLPPGSATTQQTGQAGATFAANQFGAPGATATSALAIAAALDAAATQQAKQSTGSPAPDAKATDPGSAATPTDANANAATNISTLPGAAALNARIVAGATNLSVHPSQAAAASSATLMQPQDPNAGVMPPSAGAPDLGAKPGATGIAAPAVNAANAAGLLTGANAATDPRSLTAAIEHAPRAAGDVLAGGAPDDTSSQSDTSADDNGGASTGLFAAASNAATNAPAAAPTDTTPHSGLIALPASEQVAINMKQALKAGANEIQIQLRPESLGVIDVKLNVNHDGRLTAVISANHPETLNLLKQDSSNLQQSLRDAGFNADASSLSFNLSGDAQSFAQNTPQQSGSTAPTLPSAFGGAAALGSAATARAVRQHLGALDIHV